ncbi:MAG: hypothetical protein SD837_18250 [Candidatus Electrothrix scaldis]|nr:MAG: hypothetical protein SD837_18250 [Candidatus Electrothrix sp. GW3-3]
MDAVTLTMRVIQNRPGGANLSVRPFIPGRHAGLPLHFISYLPIITVQHHA